MTTSARVATDESAEPEQPPEPRSVGAAGVLRGYVDRLRGGDVGSLPAVLGLLVLVAVFSALRPTTFTNAFNFANLINQSAAVVVIAMGLVFVLLLGEIDLSAGFTAGTGGAVMGVLLARADPLPWPLAVLGGIATGALIGLLIGLLVAKVGIPSFVVTLAAFLGLQGVLLVLIGDGGSISVRNATIVALNNRQLSVTLSWLLFAVVIGGYAFVALRSAAARRSRGLVAESFGVVIGKVLVAAVLVGAATAYLTKERSRNPSVTSIKGVPIVVVLLVVLLVGLTFLLTRTSFGRHVYAVGGNAEAARRSGINVARTKLACFLISSSLAAVAGILLASRDNGVSPSTGGAQTLLYAVGAAVIGGTSLFGGKGRPLDAVLGGLVITVIINGMGLLNQPQRIVFIVTGLVLLVASGVDAVSRRRSAASGRA